MNQHQHKVLKRMQELGETDPATLLYFMGPGTPGEFELLGVLKELKELGYVMTKNYGYGLTQTQSVFESATKDMLHHFFKKTSLERVMTKNGWAMPQSHITYWKVTEAGLEALQAAEPPKPQYLGETAVDLTTHPVYSKYTPADWALLWITLYSGIDGSHHKDWLIAQVAKILNNTQVTMCIAKWSNGTEEERFELAEPSEQFNAWKMAYEGDVYADGSTEYEFDEGIPP